MQIHLSNIRAEYKFDIADFKI